MRTREFGIRIALGAASGEVARLVLREALWPVGVGIAIGAGGALGLTGVIRNQLFGVTPSDPTTFAVVAASLLLVALAACYLPVRPATRINFATVLRTD